MKALWTSGIVALLGIGAAAAQNCDVNRDGAVDNGDLSSLLACFGTAGDPGCATADLNGDGMVNAIDLNIWLSQCAGSSGFVDLVAVSVDASGLDQQPTCEALQENKQYLPIVGPVMVTVRNAGTRSSGAFQILVFEDDNRDGQYQPPPLEEGYVVSVASLAAGESRAIAVPFSYAFNQPILGQPPRQFFGSPITAVVNSDNAVTESDLTNNRVTSAASISGPDITVSRIVPHYFRPSDQSPPTSVDFKARIGNAGSEATPSAVVVTWYNGNPAQSGVAVGSVQTGPLAPGEGAIVHLPLNTPYVFDRSMWVEATPAAGEANMQNNHHNWSCLGDINFDNQISLDDLALLLSNFGRTNVFYTDGDLNFDTIIDLSDLANMLAMFGLRSSSDCP